jgi:hypothetical protein
MNVIPDDHRNSPIHRQKSYVLATERGSRAVVMALTCASCGNKEKVNWSHGHFDTRISRYWLARGWDFHLHKRKSCICPKCKTRENVPMPTQPTTSAVVSINHKEPKTVAAPTPPLLTVPLTRDQRHKVRNQLETNFDDEFGRYRKDWSDKRIAELLDLPLAAIRDIREAAYGPISERDPEVVTLRAEFDTLKSMMHDCERRLIALEKRK